MSGAWSVEEIETLRTLVLRGQHSGAEISRALGGKYTRSAVLGKIHRLGLSMKITPVRQTAPRVPRPNGGMVNVGIAWAKPLEDKLRELAARGLNTAAIAKQLPGFTPGAIRNKAARIGLTITETQKGPRLAPSRQAGPQMRAAPFVPRIVPTSAPTNKPVRFLKLGPADCRYEIGAALARPEWFCGAPKQDGSAYCGFHHAVCHVRPVQVVRRPAAARRYPVLEAAE